MILKFSDINEDFLENDINIELRNFNNYVKNKFAKEITSIMMWLRIHKKIDNDVIKFPYTQFIIETNLTKEVFEEFLKNKNKTVLINYNIRIIGDDIIFSNLNKKVEEQLF